MKVFIALAGLFLCVGFTNISNKEYVKQYNEKGVLIAEGWMQDHAKIDFWKYYNDKAELISEGHYNNGLENGFWRYYSNGKTKLEGHFNSGKKTDWWTSYQHIEYHKVITQYKSNKKNGYRLYYNRFTLSKVEQYQLDVLKGAWTSYRSFKKDHPDFSLSDLKAKS